MFNFKTYIQDKTLLIFIKSVVEFLKIDQNLVFALNASLHFLDKISKQKIKKTIKKLEKGVGLYEAFKTENILNSYCLNFFKIAEKTGKIEEHFVNLTQFLEWKIETANSLKKSLIYPIITFVVFVFTVLLFNFYIIPQLLDLFDNVNSHLLFVLKLFAIFKYCLYLILAFIISLLILSKASSYYFQIAIYSVPILKTLFMYKTFYFILYYVYNGLKNNESLVDVLDLCIEQNSGYVKEFLKKVKTSFKKGNNLYDIFKNYKFIPADFLNIVNLINSTNSLNSYEILFNFYKNKYYNYINSIIVYLPIAIFLLISLFIMLFILFVFLPFYNIEF